MRQRPDGAGAARVMRQYPCASASRRGVCCRTDPRAGACLSCGPIARSRARGALLSQTASPHWSSAEGLTASMTKRKVAERKLGMRVDAPRRECVGAARQSRESKAALGEPAHYPAVARHRALTERQIAERRRGAGSVPQRFARGSRASCRMAPAPSRDWQRPDESPNGGWRPRQWLLAASEWSRALGQPRTRLMRT